MYRSASLDQHVDKLLEFTKFVVGLAEPTTYFIYKGEIYMKNYKANELEKGQIYMDTEGFWRYDYSIDSNRHVFTLIEFDEFENVIKEEGGHIRTNRELRFE